MVMLKTVMMRSTGTLNTKLLGGTIKSESIVRRKHRWFLANDTRTLNDVLQNFEMMQPLQRQADYSRIGGGIPPGRLGGIFVGQRHRQQMSRCDMKGNIQRFASGSICSGTFENREDAKGASRCFSVCCSRWHCSHVSEMTSHYNRG
jgi:hypothetical protein